MLGFNSYHPQPALDMTHLENTMPGKGNLYLDRETKAPARTRLKNAVLQPKFATVCNDLLQEELCKNIIQTSTNVLQQLGTPEKRKQTIYTISANKMDILPTFFKKMSD